MKKVISTLEKAQKIAIFMHVRPDGDTIGSSLALRLALKKQGKEVDCYCDEPLPPKFFYLCGSNEVLTCDVKTDYDCLVAVDCSDEYRLGKYINVFLKHRNTAIIDHHKSNTKFAKVYYIMHDYAATAILATQVIDALGVQITKDMAECLYTGLSTDTGNFSHSNTNKQVFELACRLVGCDVDVSLITTALYKSSSRARLRLLGKVLAEMRFYEEETVSIISVSRQDMIDCGALSSDTEGFIDYAIGIQGVTVAACLMEHSSNCYKVSLRSKGADVCKIALEFGGGGHTLAAGCMISGFYEDVLEKLVRAIRIF